MAKKLFCTPNFPLRGGVFESYFFLEPEANLAAVDSVLSATIKMKWFKVISQMQTNKSFEDVCNLVLQMAMELSAYAMENIEEDAPQPQVLDNNTFFKFDDEEPMETASPADCEGIRNWTNKIRDQLVCYLNDPRTDLDIWKKYPSLH